MIDSGSAITTISPRIVKELELSTIPNTNEVQIRNADGSLTKGGWTESVKAWIDTGITRGTMEIAVLETHDDKFMLGNDWISRFKPKIDWENGTVATRFGKIKLIGRRATLALQKARTSWKKKKWYTNITRHPVESDEDSDDDIGTITMKWKPAQQPASTIPTNPVTGQATSSTTRIVHPPTTRHSEEIRSSTPKTEAKVISPAMAWRPSQEEITREQLETSSPEPEQEEFPEERDITPPPTSPRQLEGILKPME